MSRHVVDMWHDYRCRRALVHAGHVPQHPHSESGYRQSSRAYAYGDAFHQRARLFHWTRRAVRSQPCLNPGGHGTVNPLDEGRHYRIAVLRRKLAVDLGGRSDVFWTQRRGTHNGRITVLSLLRLKA